MLKESKFRMIVKPILKGLTASLVLLLVYFLVLTFISGWSFALNQFVRYWYFIISLSIGFGIQVGFYAYLRGVIKNQSKKVLIASGATSTAAMISCCSHYLVNLLPIIGITGFVTIVSQYQVQFFYVGLLFNILGILYMLNKIIKYSKALKLSERV